LYDITDKNILSIIIRIIYNTDTWTHSG